LFLKGIASKTRFKFSAISIVFIRYFSYQFELKNPNVSVEGLMKLKTMSLFACISAFIWCCALDNLSYFYCLVLSVIPINIRFGDSSFDVTLRNTQRYNGYAVLSYPPVLFASLLIAHQCFSD